MMLTTTRHEFDERASWFSAVCLSRIVILIITTYVERLSSFIIFALRSGSIDAADFLVLNP